MSGEEEDLKNLVKHIMEHAMSLGNVPILVETGFGSNWEEAH